MSSASKKPTQRKKIRPEWDQLPEYFSWIPDWKKRRNYKFVGGLSQSRWAWEFLRRNIQYAETVHPIYIELWQDKKLLIASKKTDIYMTKSGLKIKHADARLKRYDTIIQGITQRYSIFCFPPHPGEDRPEIYFEQIRIPDELQARIHPLRRALERLEIAIQEGYWDTGASKAILASCRGMAVLNPPSKGKRLPKQYKDYIRILDAIYIKATNAEIADMLKTNTITDVADRMDAVRSVQTKLKRAVACRDDPYNEVALLQGPPVKT